MCELWVLLLVVAEKEFEGKPLLLGELEENLAVTSRCAPLSNARVGVIGEGKLLQEVWR